MTCPYQLIRDKDCDGLLSLQPPEGLEENRFVYPEDLFASCDSSGLLSEAFDRALANKEDPLCEKMEHQIRVMNNLWAFSFGNLIRQCIDKAMKQGDWSYIYRITPSFRRLKDELKSNETYLSSFSPARKEEFIKKADYEIYCCNNLYEAAVLLHEGKYAEYFNNLLDLFRKGETVYPNRLRIALELLNAMPDLMDSHAETVARIACEAANKDELKSLVGCLTAMLDTYINKQLVTVNGRLYLEGQAVDDKELSRLLRLLGIEVQLLSLLNTGLQPNQKYAQMARLASHLSQVTDSCAGEARPVRLVVKAMDFLQNGPAECVPADVVDAEDPDRLIHFLLHCPVRSSSKPMVFADRGIIRLADGHIDFYPYLLADTDRKLPDCEVILSVLGGKVRLCTQLPFDRTGLTDPDPILYGRSWLSIYLKRYYPDPVTKAPRMLPDGIYPMDYREHADEACTHGLLCYTNPVTGNVHDCTLTADRVLYFPGGSLEGLIEKSTHLRVAVTSDGNTGENRAELRTQILRHTLGKIRAGDSFTALCVSLENGRYKLYGENGVACHLSDGQSARIGTYYQVRVLEKGYTEALVEITGESDTTFDARATDRSVATDYVSRHRRGPFEISPRIIVTELMFLLDRLGSLSSDPSARQTYIQFAKLAACIERSKLSYLYDNLLRKMVGLPIHLNPSLEDQFPRLDNA